MPLLLNKSTSTVGIPLLSRICLALIFVITEGTDFLIWWDCWFTNHNVKHINYITESFTIKLWPEMKISTKIKLERIHIIRFFPAFSREPNRGERERVRERGDYDEDDGIGALGPNGSIDGVFDFPRERVLFQVRLHRHFLLLLSRSALYCFGDWECVCAQLIQDFSEEFVLVLKVWKPWELRERERESWALNLLPWWVAWELGIWIHRDFAALLSKLENLRTSQQLAGFKNF